LSDKERMSSVAHILIHASQFPENVRRDLRESLRTRRVNHKFLYDSVKQTQKWLALHQAYSPSRRDPGCRAIYVKCFKAAAAHIQAKHVHVIGLGCGGGQKDARLLKLLKARGREIFYTPCDVSAAMVLAARRTVLAVIPEQHCFPFVCDLATTDNLPDIFKQMIREGRRVGDPNYLGTATRRPSPNVSRLITFFGMIPNFEPQTILPKLASLIRPRNFLLLSVNLAPGNNYAAGVKKVLPQYDNPLTRDWLMMFLLDLGIARGDGELRFKIETDAANGGLKRITANFHFKRARRIAVDGERFDFPAGSAVQLFFSYRYTPERVRAVLGQYGLGVRDQWITQSGEEGVFLCCDSEGRALRVPN
jgi:uncharacterized SAM-dependent methyltransferase